MHASNRDARERPVERARMAWSWAWVALLAAGCAGSGCTGFGSRSSSTQSVWRSLDQYVRIEPRDDARGPSAVPSDHPADLAAAQVGALLEGLRVRTSPGEEPAPLFAPEQVADLARQVPEAFRRAGPWQDVTFAVVGQHKKVRLGFGSGPAVTTGRMFVESGSLHLILGEIHRAVDYYSGRPVDPFQPGSRRGPRPGSRGVELGEGVAGSGSVLLVRPDWVRAELATLAAGGSASPAVGAAQPSPAPAAQGEPAPPGDPPGGPRSGPDSSGSPREGLEAVEQRLRGLQELHRKGLITDQEYQAKRKQILDEL